VSSESDSSDSGDSTEPDPSDSDSSDTDTSDDGWEPNFVPFEDLICYGNFYCTPGCDVYQQDCPEGEKCRPYDSTGVGFDAQKCVVVTGDQMPGEACTSEGPSDAPDDCDETSTCFEGICRSFCSGTADNPSCADGFGCADEFGSVPFGVCLPTCDPLAQDCETETDSCYWTSEQFLCSPSGSIPFGEPCGFVNDCSAGSACVATELIPNCLGTACCSPFCNLEQPDCASLPGTECVAWFEPGQAPAGLELLGSCLVP
jgi:hypothetical protein